MHAVNNNLSPTWQWEDMQVTWFDIIHIKYSLHLDPHLKAAQISAYAYARRFNQCQVSLKTREAVNGVNAADDSADVMTNVPAAVSKDNQRLSSRTR